MSQLDDEIEVFIEGIKTTINKELKYIEGVDWTGIVQNDDRAEEYKLQHLIVNRTMLNAIALYDLAKNNLKNKLVKTTLEELLSLAKTHEVRSSEYLKKQDWTIIEDDSSKAREKRRFEVEFQSTIQKDIVDLSKKIRKIDISENKQSVTIGIHGDIPIPLLMRDAMEERYPEILEVIENKKAKKNGNTERKTGVESAGLDSTNGQKRKRNSRLSSKASNSNGGVQQK
jgi:hypothetical protein